MLFQRAVGLFRDKSYREAIAVFRQVFERDPNPFVLFNIGRCYEELGELEDAAKYYQRSVGLEGLPREAKVDALMRLEHMEETLKVRVSEREARAEALKRIDRGVFAARAASSQGFSGPVGPEPDDGAGPGWPTWLGGGLLGLGVVSLTLGGIVYADVESGLDRQKELSAQYVATGNDALRTKDADKARAAQGKASEVNALADEIEASQRWSAGLFTAGGIFLISGLALVTFDLVLSPEAPPAGEGAASWRLELAPTGVGWTTRF